MFEEIIVDLAETKEDILKLKRNFDDNPLEKSLDIIIDQINLDVVNILKYDRV